MNDQLFLSIIIPIYNCEKYLKECLDSMVNQDIDISLYEIICVNDGSSDNSQNIIDSFAVKYNNFIVLSQSNKGVSAARNYGLSVARGQYIWFVDADDFIQYNILSKIKLSLQTSGCDRLILLSYVFYNDFSNTKKNQMIAGELKSNYKYKDVLVTRTIFSYDLIFSNNISFYENINYGEDAIFNYQTRIVNHHDKVFNYTTYYFRKHSESTTAVINDNKIHRVVLSNINGWSLCRNFYLDNQKDSDTIHFLYWWTDYLFKNLSLLRDVFDYNDLIEILRNNYQKFHISFSFKSPYYSILLKIYETRFNKLFLKNSYDYVLRWKRQSDKINSAKNYLMKLKIKFFKLLKRVKKLLTKFND